jgi:hypothetical protein
MVWKGVGGVQRGAMNIAPGSAEGLQRGLGNHLEVRPPAKPGAIIARWQTLPLAPLARGVAPA